MKRFLLLLAIWLTTLCSFALDANGPVGFVNINDLGNFGITGGGAGKVVHVKTRAEFQTYCTGNTPYVIVLDADLTGKGMNELQDEQNIGSNKTIIGSGSGKVFKGICLNLSGQSNVIFRNISLTKGIVDGMSFRNCHHVWIDHCDLGNSQDGLLDFTLGSDYLTVSWTKLHDHDKVSIINSGTCHYEDYGKEHVTFAHCWFANNVQRNPRIGYGMLHIYNCYWTNISSYCIGVHSQGQALSEYNYFTSSAKKAFENQYTTVLPYCGYITDNGSFLDGSNPRTASTCTYTGVHYTPKDFYNFEFDQTAVNDVPTDIQSGVGNKDGLQYEPILNPGNGAINVPNDMKLTWGNMDGVSQTKTYFGTSRDALAETDLNTVSLEPATTYYWKVVFVVEGVEHASPVYQFTTAASTASYPSPANDATSPWYRSPVSQYAYCTTSPLTWNNAFDAVSYKVFMATDESELENGLVGETSKCKITPDNIKLGEKYFWRVDAVTKNGSVIQGQVWNFSTPKTYLTEGLNECENMYKTGIAFNYTGAFGFSGNKGIRGDQGPGAVCGLWNGDDGKYAVETSYANQSVGAGKFALTVNGQFIDEWYSDPKLNTVGTRKTRHTVNLKKGDEIRLEFIAGPRWNGEINEGYSLLDCIRFTATDKDVIDNPRPSAQPHEPVSTKGFDCEYLLTSNTLFCDTLGTVGDKGNYQISDDYCSWMTYNHPNNKVVARTGRGWTDPATDKSGNISVDYSPVVSSTWTMNLYVKGVELAKFYYTIMTSGAMKVTWQEINGTDTGSISGESTTENTSPTLEVPLDKTKSYKLTLEATSGMLLFYAYKLYKVAPSPYDYYVPEIPADADYQLIWSTSMIMYDADGVKGDKGKCQIADEYESWCQYINPSANEVQAKNGSNAVYYYDPLTDQECSQKKITSGSGYCYVVGTSKKMIYYLKQCEKLKYYYTGTGSAANAVVVTVKDMDSGETSTINGPAAPGKAKKSAAVEVPLNSKRKYTVTIAGDTGDMLIYATKLWKGEGGATLLGDANNDGKIDVADITSIASWILGSIPTDFNEFNADANQDGKIDVADITATAAIILKD